MLAHEKELTGKIIGAAIEVHKALGPGLLESAYQACLAHELRLQGIGFEQEKPLHVEYEGALRASVVQFFYMEGDRILWRVNYDRQTLSTRRRQPGPGHPVCQGPIGG